MTEPQPLPFPRRLRLPRFSPRATYALMAVNLVVFVVDMLTGGLAKQYGALAPVLVTRVGQWWRLIAAGFLHADILHIATNLYACYGLGRLMERFSGPLRFLAIYCLSLLGCSVLVTLLSRPDRPTVGASGAIMGVLGALLVYFWRYRESITGAQRLLASLGRTALINIGIGLLPGISWWGHLGGFLAGVGAGVALLPRYVHPDWAAEALEMRPLESGDYAGIATVAAVEIGLLALAFWLRG